MLQVVQRAVSSLIPYARNERTHSDAQVAQIAASIREFGWTNPVLIDEADGLIAGHGRLLAARKLGMADVPAIILTGLSDGRHSPGRLPIESQMDEPSEKHPGGRPPWEPTPENRQQAEAMAGYGVPHHQIAAIVGVDEKTLRKHLGPELKLGEAKATANIAKNLYTRATDGGELGAMIFWLKARAGWRETVRQEQTGPDGRPLFEGVTVNFVKSGERSKS